MAGDLKLGVRKTGGTLFIYPVSPSSVDDQLRLVGNRAHSLALKWHRVRKNLPFCSLLKRCSRDLRDSEVSSSPCFLVASILVPVRTRAKGFAKFFPDSPPYKSEFENALCICPVSRLCASTIPLTKEPIRERNRGRQSYCLFGREEDKVGYGKAPNRSIRSSYKE